MPKITRWFPVSHDLNSDHELWEMTNLLGDRSLRIWLEFLSIADRNEGVLPAWSDSFAATIRHKCHTTRTRVRQVWDHGVRAGWLVCDPTPRVAKYSKYHRTREQVRLPSEPSESLPNKHIKIKNPTSDSAAEAADHNSLKQHWEHVARPEEAMSAKRKTKLPQNFSVSDAVLAWSIKEQMPDPVALLPAFVDYHLANDSKFADWDAALRTWIRNDARWSSQKKTKADKVADFLRDTLRSGGVKDES